MLDKERLANILEDKLNEGYSIINGMTVADKEFANACCSMFDIERTIKQLRKTDEEVAFEQAMTSEPIQLKPAKEVEEALAKNEDMEVEL